LRFDILLAQFLYQHKILALPGIGTFTLEGHVLTDDSQPIGQAPMEGISFSHNSPPLPDETLIDFIRTHTGLTLSKQFINIGKPLYLEGIGTVQKIKTTIEFIPGMLTHTKMDALPERFADSTRNADYEEARAAGANRGGGRKIMAALGVLATLALVAWGGYYFYNKKKLSSDRLPNTLNNSADVNLLKTDTLTATNLAVTAVSKISDSNSVYNKDTAATATITTPISSPGAAPQDYKFVVETTASKTRALSRFGQLTKNGVAVSMETKDSVVFKIFVIMNAPAADTAHIKDSLNVYFNYDATAKKFKRFTTIEH
jgi:hypothetical protein